MVIDHCRLVTLLVVLLFAGALHAQTPNLLFEGADDLVTLPNSVLNELGTGPFTVEAWVRGTEADQVAHPRILSNRDVANNGFMMGFHGIWGGSAHKMLCMQLDGLNYILINNGTYNGNILDGACHHVAVSKDLDSLRFYVDGAHIGSKVLQGNPSAATNALNMLIGNDGPDPQPFQGNISQVRLWDFVRTQAEIQADMNYSIPGSTPGLVGYWEMNEGVGQSIADAVGTSTGFLGPDGSVEVSDPTWIDDGCDLNPDQTGLEQWNAATLLHIHPNPTQEQVTIKLMSAISGTANITVIDDMGRVAMPASTLGMASAEKHSHTIDLSSLSNGTYVVRVEQNGEVSAHRLLIAR